MRGVAIVGAGPAEVVLAHLLRRERIPFLVFERKTRVDPCRRFPKAGLIEYRMVQLLRRENIAPSILDFSVENHRLEFRTPDESELLDYAAFTLAAFALIGAGMLGFAAAVAREHPSHPGHRAWAGYTIVLALTLLVLAWSYAAGNGNLSDLMLIADAVVLLPLWLILDHPHPPNHHGSPGGVTCQAHPEENVMAGKTRFLDCPAYPGQR